MLRPQSHLPHGHALLPLIHSHSVAKGMLCLPIAWNAAVQTQIRFVWHWPNFYLPKADVKTPRQLVVATQYWKLRSPRPNAPSSWCHTASKSHSTESHYSVRPRTVRNNRTIGAHHSPPSIHPTTEGGQCDYITILCWEY